MLDHGHSSKHTTSSPCGISSLSSIVLVPDCHTCKSLVSRLSAEIVSHGQTQPGCDHTRLLRQQLVLRTDSSWECNTTTDSILYLNRTMMQLTAQCRVQIVCPMHAQLVWVSSFRWIGKRGKKILLKSSKYCRAWLLLVYHTYLCQQCAGENQETAPDWQYVAHPVSRWDFNSLVLATQWVLTV